MTVTTVAGPRLRWRGPSIGWRQREGRGLMLALAVFIVLFSVIPVGRLILTAFDGGVVAFWQVIDAPEVWRASRNTLVVALGSGGLAMLIGVSFALILSVTNLRARTALAFIMVLSLMIAPQISALAFKTLAGPASPLLKLIGLAPSPGTPNPMLGQFGIILVMGLHHAPLVAITLASGLASIPRPLIEAARLEGASPWQVVRYIMLPLLRPFLLTAALLVFVAGTGNFGIPALLGLPVGYVTLPTLLFRKLASFGPGAINDAAAISVLIAAIACTGVIAAGLVLARAQNRLESDHRLEPFWDLGRWRLAMEMAVWGFVALTILLPLASLVATSVVPAYGVRLSLESATLRQYAEVLFRQDLTVRAFRNSLMLAGAAALSLGVIALISAYVLDRAKPKARAAAFALIELPYAVPGIVLAIACILLFIKPLPLIGVSIYATPWIILFAYHARFYAIALKPVLAAMATLDDAVQEAAVCDGVGLYHRLRHIVAPLVFPAVFAGMLMVFLLAFNELTVSALLWSAGTETLGVALLSLEDSGLAAEAAAVAVAATLLVLVLMLVMQLMARRLPPDALPWQGLAGPGKLRRG
ncbi:MAG: iron ABC transporter permease [Hoeflea sp.]|uniref:ABC transporter permease n=1 Tax=Hoeflea sp. TaxID=1940281 RepID=UPI001DF39B0E|nr:iron ABC transporter permease [Hoeflea sp.]MBU4529957.1 iron ABC transporter permease [Alphaproteobacteria bacterium]MBU4543184.1 iron ABC transporter permease [Alphaproteobacteria bacterium]MBU4550276.1 iron ABC transporter permease [Alphaproteobacteria bacterium]MBV1722450.1 iron ABC transporter permease [Hoeflea sp.]MBV1761600.1 iron ABC transporter permease [Hoeflea sp.]